MPVLSQSGGCVEITEHLLASPLLQTGVFIVQYNLFIIIRVISPQNEA